MKYWNVQTRKKYIMDFMIEFKALAIKTETDDIYICHFLIEEEFQEQYYQNYIGISTYSSTRDTQEVESSNYIS